MPFTVRAVNTAADSENKIHDDAIAAAYGFRGGLVPGVTVYGYMASAVIEHLGREWMERGAMDVRFHRPVYEGDSVIVTIQPESAGRVSVAAGECATASAWLHDGNAPSLEDERPLERRPASIDALRPGTVMGTLVQRLDLCQSKMSAPLNPSVDGYAHPAILIALANEIFVRNFELGPWIHVASQVRKFGAVRDGDDIRVRARIENRYEGKGHEFVEYETLILAGVRPVEHVRHTAIWRPRKSQ